MDGNIFLTQRHKQNESTVSIVSKRKSVTGEDSQQLKRLHMMDQGQVAKVPQDRKITERKTHADQQLRTNLRNEQDTGDKLTSKSWSGAEHNQTVQTDSDYEWERISIRARSFKRENKKTESTENTKRAAINNKTTTKRNSLKGTKVQRSNITVVTTTNPTKATMDIMENRGSYMTEDREMIVTPVKIEFNLVNTMDEFNIIVAVSTLFTNIQSVDVSLKVHNNDRTEVIWEDSKVLSEDDTFIQQFNMREQTFRNGNKKVTLYCTLESYHNINRLKFMEPVKSFITDNNIWIKPDFYSTNLVSSPGFFTMVHQKMTNKQVYVKSLRTILFQIEEEGNNQTEQGLSRKPHHNEGSSRKHIPSFHLETNVRKWGDLKVEVLGVYCSKEDSTHLKYLLSKAGEKGLITKRVFVPAGIHLLEGKEVMTDILTEHSNFLKTVTSIQLSGISRQEMYESGNGDGRTTQEILSQCKGVQSIEETYLTEKAGNWMVVITKDSLGDFSRHITHNIAMLYKNRKGTTPKMVATRNNKEGPSYKLLLVDKMVRGVGTYAEVLKRRFQVTNIDSNESTKSHYTESGNTNTQQPVPELNNKEEQTDDRKTGVSKYFPEGMNGTYPKNDSTVQTADTTNRRPNSTVMGEGSDSNSSVQAQGIEQIRDANHSDTNLALEHTTRNTMDIHNRLTTIENNFMTQIQEIQIKNQKVIGELENQFEKRIEDIIGSKMKIASNMVADTVTSRMMKIMQPLLQTKRFYSQRDDINQFFETNAVSKQKQPETDKLEEDCTNHYHQGYLTVDNTKQMLSALTEIETETYTQTTHHGPPHDNKQGSGTNTG